MYINHIFVYLNTFIKLQFISDGVEENLNTMHLVILYFVLGSCGRELKYDAFVNFLYFVIGRCGRELKSVAFVNFVFCIRKVWERSLNPLHLLILYFVLGRCGRELNSNVFLNFVLGRCGRVHLNLLHLLILYFVLGRCGRKA